MKKISTFWFLALIITLSAAYYQRITGPTYPKSYKIQSGNEIVKFKLLRSSDTGKDLDIKIPTGKKTSGFLFFRRYNTADKWAVVEMKNRHDTLIASMPWQPAAGKLQYTVRLRLNEKSNWQTVSPVIVAFGELWTGVPFGWDLTDNKILIGFIGWLVAIAANRKKERMGWFIFAAILTLIVYSIPHSLFGSELDYSSGIIKQG